MAKKIAKKKPAAKKKVAAKKVAAKKAAPKKAAKKKVAAKKLNPVPDGLHTATVNLVLRDCTKAIAFYQAAFGAKVLSNMPTPDGKGVWHAALQIGDSQLFVNDPDPMNPYREPAGQIWLYGADVDARYDRAVKAGAKATVPLWDAFWGDRFGMVVDPFGQTWTLAERQKNMTEEEMRVAGEAFGKQMAAHQGSADTQPSMPAVS